MNAYALVRSLEGRPDSVMRLATDGGGPKMVHTPLGMPFALGSRRKRQRPAATADVRQNATLDASPGP